MFFGIIIASFEIGGIYMASVIRLSYEEMEELELWASISDTITILYD